MPKKIPMRKCVVSNERYPKGELLRIIRTPEGNIEIEQTGKKNGHGAYLKKDINIIQEAKKNNSLARALEVEISEEFWEELEEYMK